MTVFKDHRFPVAVHWVGERLTLASAPGKADLQVATPPEFHGGIAGVWNPEDLLVASTAACFAVTLAAVAERRHLPLRDLDVNEWLSHPSPFDLPPRRPFFACHTVGRSMDA